MPANPDNDEQVAGSQCSYCQLDGSAFEGFVTALVFPDFGVHVCSPWLAHSHTPVLQIEARPCRTRHCYCEALLLLICWWAQLKPPELRNGYEKVLFQSRLVGGHGRDAFQQHG
jgi:hypothetical protein